MDPTANLQEQLRITERMLSPDSEYIDTGDALRLAELVQSLHKWITTGGHLPTCWAPNPIQKHTTPTCDSSVHCTGCNST